MGTPRSRNRRAGEKRATRQLQSPTAEQRGAPFEAIVEMAPDALVVTDAAGRISLVNRQTEQLFGYAREELLAQPVEVLLPERFHAAHRSHRADYLAAPRTRPMGTHLQLWGRRRDGSEFPVAVSLSPLPNPEGESAFAAVSTIRDLTERQRLEAARERAAGLESIIAAIPDAVLVTDPDGHVIHANAAFHALYATAERPDFLTLPAEERTRLLQLCDQDGRPLPPERLPFRTFQQAAVGSSPEALLGRARALDGREMWVHVAGGPLRDHEGHVVGSVVSIRDITAQHQLEREVAEQAVRLAATFESITDAVVVSDTQGRIVQANAAYHGLYCTDLDPGFLTLPSEEQTRLVRMRDRGGHPLPPDQYPFRYFLQHTVSSTGDPQDLWVQTLDGHDALVSITGGPIRDDEGRVVGAVFVQRDITEQWRLERRTRESLDALLAIAEAVVQSPGEAGDLMLGRDHSQQTGRHVSAMAQRLAELTCRVLGCSRVGIIAIEPDTQLMRAVAAVGLSPEQEQQWWAEQAEQEARGVRYGEGADPAELARFEAGESLVVDMRVPPYDQFPNPYGITTSLFAPMRVGERLAGILSLDYGGPPHVFDDKEQTLASAVAKLAALVIERGRLLHEREEARASELALRVANRQLDEFLHMVNHELRNPLTILRSNLQLASRRLAALSRTLAQQDETPDAQQAAHQSDQAAAVLDAAALDQVRLFLARADAQVTRLDRMTADLVDASRVQTGKLELHRAPCDLAGLVRESVEEQRLLQPSRSIQLELPALPTGEGIQVVADGERIRQALTNYLTNALKYSAADRPVVTAVVVEPGHVRVSVRDEGPGLTAEQQWRVWERFHRAEGINVQSGSGVGLGLGLYISQQIIEQHGGTVGVQSEVGAGSTFWFTLPLAATAG